MAMNACKICGFEIKWRTIDGQKIPMGCECGYDDSRFLPTFSKDGYTRELHCPKCRSLVYFVRHNGGSVWLDDLGPPWPKHPCYDKLQGSTEGLAEILGYEECEGTATLAKLTLKTDLGQRIVHVSFGKKILEIYPWPGFWEISPAPVTGEEIYIDTVDELIKVRNQFEFMYWSIRTETCEDCGQLFLKKRHHLDLCRSRRERHPG